MKANLHFLIRHAVLLAALAVGGFPHARAQDVHFDFNGEGQWKAMTHWGVDTAWPSYDNVRQSIYHMGVDQVDVVRINFFMDEPLDDNGAIGPESRERIDWQMELAALAGDKPLALTPATGEDWDGPGPGTGPTHPYYLDNANQAIPERWMALMEATQEYVGQPIHALEIFNEPDYWGGMGSTETLRKIMLLAADSPNFQGSELQAGSTLCSCAALDWYNPVADVTTQGTTHQLASWWGQGSENYINFFLHVLEQGDEAYNPELHSMAEVLYGAEYGLVGGIWWADALLTRGVMVNAVQGRRLGYAERRDKDSVAAVYRAPDNGIIGFAGSFERTGPNHSYRFVSDAQDVFFDGMGPLRSFMLPTWADHLGGMVRIDAVPGFPALDGHTWKIVNRATGEVLEVEGGSTNNGANISTGADEDALHQKWLFSRDRSGYYSIINAKSRKTADDFNWSLENGGNIAQWDYFGNLNQIWWIEPAGQGYFYLHNGHSNLLVEDDSVGDNVRQWSSTGAENQQWSFVLADAEDRGTLVAHYEFESNTLDSAGTNDGSANGSYSYLAGPVGQAINLTGGSNDSGDHINLPDDVADSEDLTIATWVYWRGGTAGQALFDFGIDTNRYLYLTPSDENGEMKFGITTNSWWEEQTVRGDGLPQDRWIHIALTIGGNTAILYLNGVPQVAGYLFRDPYEIFDVPSNYWPPDWEQQNFIGRSQFENPTFNGAIDDFRVYDYALSATEIAALLPEVSLLDDAFEGNLVKWANFDANYWDNPGSDDVDTGGWDISPAKSHSGASSVRAGAGAVNLESRPLDAAGGDSIQIEFWYLDNDLDGENDIRLELYDGSIRDRKPVTKGVPDTDDFASIILPYLSRENPPTSGPDNDNPRDVGWVEVSAKGHTKTQGTWQYFKARVMDPRFMIPDFGIRFNTQSINPGGEIFIDDVVVKVIK